MVSTGFSPLTPRRSVHLPFRRTTVARRNQVTLNQGPILGTASPYRRSHSLGLRSLESRRESNRRTEAYPPLPGIEIPPSCAGPEVLRVCVEPGTQVRLRNGILLQHDACRCGRDVRDRGPGRFPNQAGCCNWRPAAHKTPNWLPERIFVRRPPPGSGKCWSRFVMHGSMSRRSSP